MEEGISSRIFRLIRYFDFFDYPLKSIQIAQLLNLDYEDCEQSVLRLEKENLIDIFNEFVFFPGKQWTVNTRKKEEAILNRRKAMIFRCAWILSHFPFVRGIMLTGSASKGVHQKHDDFDFFVFAKPGRIWICRAFIRLFRKVISMNYRLSYYKYFCANYFRNSKSLEIEEKDEFTAMEIATAQPIHNSTLYNKFIDENKWTEEYYPGKLSLQLPMIKFRFGLLQMLSELLINAIGGRRLENYIREKFFIKWQKSGLIKSRKQFDNDCNEDVIKLNTHIRREHILDKLYSENWKENQSRQRTKIATVSMPRISNPGKHKINILLTHAYYLSKTKSEKRIMKPYVPLGPLSIASYLKEKGHEVSFYDTTFVKNEKEFTNYILKNPFSLVGIYVLETTRKNALKMIDICRTMGIGVIVGGPDPSNNPDFYIDYGVNSVVVGEGEESLHEFLEALNSGSRALTEIDGLYIEGGKNKPRTDLIDLDELPMPERDLVDFKSYKDIWKEHHGISSMHLTTSRGCPYRCTWCAKPVFGSTFRQRSAKLVADEMEHIKNQYNPDQLWFTDDILGLKNDWIFQLNEELKERDVKIPFECLSRVDLVDKDSLEALKEMGCFRIWFGAESGSQKIIDKMKKGFKVEQIKTAAKLVNDAGIDVGFFIMLGYPTETIEDIDLTRKLLNEVSPQYCGTAIAYPMHNTEFFKEVQSSILPRRQNLRLENRNIITFKATYPQFFYKITLRLIGREHNMRKTKSISRLGKIKHRILQAMYNFMRHGKS